MTKRSLGALQICKNISNQTYLKAIQRLTDWVESTCSVNVYLEEEKNYFIPTPVEELEELDYNFGDIEIDRSQQLHIKVFSLLHEAAHAYTYMTQALGEKSGHLSVVEREKAAWDDGEGIAEKNNLVLDKGDWTGYRDKCIKLYMEEE